jgi:hypothetical protein
MPRAAAWCLLVAEQRLDRHDVRASVAEVLGRVERGERGRSRRGDDGCEHEGGRGHGRAGEGAPAGARSGHRPEGTSAMPLPM